MLEGFAELTGVAAEGGAAGGGLLDEVALNVEIADPACGFAELSEELEGLVAGPGVRRLVGELGEEFELGFDAAGGGAQVVDGFLAGPGEALKHGSFERGGEVAEGLEGVRGLGGAGHRCAFRRLRGKEKRRPCGGSPLTKSNEEDSCFASMTNVETLRQSGESGG